MLEIIIPEDEFFDPVSNKFISTPSCKISLEHSLISIAKWESKWHIPYLSEIKRTVEQENDYIRCMIVDSKFKNELALKSLSSNNIKEIISYIDDPNTATTFKKTTTKVKKEIVTAEILYSRMFEYNIPMECQKWHLNRLLTLIRVCSLSQTPNKKMSKKETAQWNAEQNALRRAKSKTKG